MKEVLLPVLIGLSINIFTSIVSNLSSPTRLLIAAVLGIVYWQIAIIIGRRSQSSRLSRIPLPKLDDPAGHAFSGGNVQGRWARVVQRLGKRRLLLLAVLVTAAVLVLAGALVSQRSGFSVAFVLGWLLIMGLILVLGILPRLARSLPEKVGSLVYVIAAISVGVAVGIGGESLGLGSQPVVSGTEIQQFAIAVGDEVVLDGPGSGAGRIETPGTSDVYTFNVEAGQEVFFDVTGDCRGGDLMWSLAGGEDQLFEQFLRLSDSCTDVGPVALPSTGEYRLRVYGYGDDIGTYRFKLWDAPVQQFAIAVGDEVVPDGPGSGAGRIETPGTSDVYTFTAEAGQEVFFDVTDCGGGYLKWSLTGGDDPLFDQVLRLSDCADAGPIALPNAGEYRLRVYGYGDDIGTYRFKLWDAPVQQFAIAVGDEVVLDGPGSGAGRIETPGTSDVYTFTAEAGQDVFFDVTGDCRGGDLKWSLIGGGEDPLFDQSLRSSESCLDAETVNLPNAGEYRLRAYGEGDDIGSYQFKLWDVPVQQFAIAVGDEVVPDGPGSGAGRIETPGTSDVYTFTAEAGQDVFFYGTGDCRGGDLKWSLALARGGEDTLFDQTLRSSNSCSDVGPITLPDAGEYQLRVYGYGDDIGPYQFQTLSR